MKKWIFIIGAAAAAGLTGCSSAYFASAGYGNDDLYAIHDKAEIARRQQAEAERKKAEAEARKAEWEARLAEAEANAAQQRYYESATNPYEAVLADTYESAYARRLRGFESPTYRLPSSYYDFRYGNSFHYVSAYDPAFYNVMIMGDEVWVEPKYITAMFGTWGRPSVYMDPWYYGWSWRPYYSWGFSFGSWGWGFGSWYDPWYYPGWGWGHPHWGGHGHGRPTRPYASNIVHRANPYAPPSSGNRYYTRDQRFGTSGTSPNRGSSSRFGVRNSSSGSQSGSQSAKPGSTSNRGSRNSYSNPSYRNNSGGNTYNRGGSSNSSGSSYNRGSSSSGSSGSYNRGSSSSSSSGSYNRGSSGGGSSRNAGGR